MSALIRPPADPGGGTLPGTGAGAGGGHGFDITDLKQYFHIVVKRIWLVAVCFVVSLAVMVVILIRQVPVYRCSATLLLSRGLPVPSRLRQQEKAKGPKPLRIEVKFWKGTNFSADDVRQLRDLLAKQHYFRAVEGRKEERAADVLGTGRPGSRVVDTAARGWLYSFWVTFSSRPLPEPAAKKTAATTTKSTRKRRVRRK